MTIPLRPALELTPVAVAIVTDSGKLLECNGEFTRLLNAADGIRLAGGDVQATDEFDRAGRWLRQNCCLYQLPGWLLEERVFALLHRNCRAAIVEGLVREYCRSSCR